MRMTSRTLLLFVCTSLAGGVACSDDSPTIQPAPDSGFDSTPDSGGADASTTLVNASTSGGLTSETIGETSERSMQTVSSEVSSSEPDASQMLTDVETTTSGEPADAGGDASKSSGDTEVDAGDTSQPSPEASVPEEVEFMTPRGPCDVADRIGRFTFEAQSDFGIVQGSVSNGVLPTSVPAVEVESNDCRLNKRRTLTCLPSCVAGETCGEGGTCIPFPEPISVGPITVTGLTKPTSMSAQAPSFLYFAPGATNPPYAPLSEIILSAAGAAVPGFNLFGVGSEPLTASPTWTLKEGEDFDLAWPATDASAGTTVLVEVMVDQHGASPLSLSCEFPDTGNAVVPASMIDQLLQAGISGFPNGRITRRTVDHIDVDLGCIELAVGSPRSAKIVVAGHTPCDEPEDCPDGQHCNLAIEQCEDN